MPDSATRGSYWISTTRGLARERGGLWRALRWLVMYGLGRIVLVRRIAQLSRKVRRPLSTPRPEPALDADVTGIVDEIRSNGFDARLRLPGPLLRELSELGSQVLAPAPFSQGGDPRFPAVLSLARDPTLVAIAERYLGTTPFYQGSRIWWTRPDDRSDLAQTGARFHYDLYDYRSLLFLVYLTDVDGDSAPHACVRGSHRVRRFADQLHPRRYRSDERIARTYGTERVVTFCGPAGMVIVEDPFCFHKVNLPCRQPRLALQILYTGSDLPAPSFS